MVRGGRPWISRVPLLCCLLLSACGGGGSGGGEKIRANAQEAGAGEQSVCKTDQTAQPFSFDMSQTSAKGTKVMIESDPPVPTKDDLSTWTLKISDASGAPVVGKTVLVTCAMSHAGGFSHGCPPVSVREVGGGTYVAEPVDFNMIGHWSVDVQVGGEVVTFQLCIE